MSLHPGETGVCPAHGRYDEFCGKCADLKKLGLCGRCKHTVHAPGKCTQRVSDAAGDTDDCSCMGGHALMRARTPVAGRFSSRHPNFVHKGRDLEYAYKKRGWDPTSCPCCGNKELEEQGDCPAGKWWWGCKRCGLPTRDWKEFHLVNRTPDCQPCYEEEGSYACVRPAHKIGSGNKPSYLQQPDVIALPTQIEPKLKWIMHGQYAHIDGAPCGVCNNRAGRALPTDHLPDGSF